MSPLCRFVCQMSIHPLVSDLHDYTPRRMRTVSSCLLWGGGGVLARGVAQLHVRASGPVHAAVATSLAMHAFSCPLRRRWAGAWCSAAQHTPPLVSAASWCLVQPCRQAGWACFESWQRTCTARSRHVRFTLRCPLLPCEGWGARQVSASPGPWAVCNPSWHGTVPT